MLPPNCFTPWGSGALYAELYVGLCRALVAPWLGPWGVVIAPGASRCSPARRDAPVEPPTAGPTAAASLAPANAELPAPLPPDSVGALIIPFYRAPARLARPDTG
jgi:hypothetical protein